MRKNLISLVVCIFLLTFMVGYAQTNENIPVASGDWTYITNSRGITLTNYIGNATDLSIPDMLDGKLVTEIGSRAFQGNSRLRRVNIGTVRVIGSYAFDECVNLEEVILGYDMSSISAGTFRNCHKLKSIYIPKKVTSIGDFAFQNCYELREAYFSSVRSIGESAFDNCYQLTIVVYGDRLTTVGSFAFRNTEWAKNQSGDFVFIGKGILLEYKGNDTEVTVPIGAVKLQGTFDGNDKIEKVTLPETVLEIGKYTFRNVVNLKSIKIPQYVTTVNSNAFEGCRALETVEFSKYLRSINGNAFLRCESLKEITIPSRVSQLNGNVFAECPSLRSVTVPDTVKKIDKNAFRASDAVVLNVTLNSAGDTFAKENGIPYKYPVEQYGDFLYYRADDGVHITKYIGRHMVVSVPGRITGGIVTVIDAAAFQNISCVRRVLLPASLKEIGSWAFSYMKNLEYVVIPAGLKSIGDSVFTGSYNLKEISFPRRLQTIGADPIGLSSETLICANDNSTAAEILTEMGYSVQSFDQCSILTDQYLTEDQCIDCAQKSSDPGPETREILEIPEGLTLLSADLIDNAGDDLVLFIPSSVMEIEEDILTDRTLTIVSNSGTTAESFARDHGIKFLTRTN